MRKAFNFFRSYYDVAMELNDKDRLAFYDALLSKQFNNCEPTLNGMAKFAYLSQKHSIDTQVKGYFDKTKNPLFNPSYNPCQGGVVGGSVDPSVQEKEKEKEKVQDVISFSKRKSDFLNWFNNQKKICTGKEGNFKTLSKQTENNLKQVLAINYSSIELTKAFKNMCNNKWVIENKQITPDHFLRIGNLEKYINEENSNNNTYVPNLPLN